MSTLLLTRPADDSAAMKAELAGEGVHCLISPMLEIQPIATQPAGTPDILVASSRHAFTALHTIPPAWQNAALYVVGEQTAQAAAQAGLTQSASIAATMQALLTSLRRDYAEKTPNALYLRGEHISLSPAEALPDIQWQELICYRANAAEAFSGEAKAALAGDVPLAVAFYSARTAQIFQQLLDARAAQTPPLSAYCFSDQVAQALEANRWQGVHIAAFPNQEAMLALLRAKLL